MAASEDLGALPAVAREAIRARLEQREPNPRPAHLARRAPVFVTLRIGDELRGCIGSLEPHHDDLVAETMDRAIAAAFEDPRFPPLTNPELDRVRIEVSVLGPREPVESATEIDPHRHGVDVSDAAGRRGVLLPGVVDSAEQQIGIARRKAGIDAETTVALCRFTVEKVVERDATRHR